MVLAERISCSSLGVLAEIVGRELRRLAEEGAELGSGEEEYMLARPEREVG